MLLTTPTARYIVHIIVAFGATFFPLEYAAHDATSRSILYGAIAAGARAALGALTSTNPSIGKNVI